MRIDHTGKPMGDRKREYEITGFTLGQQYGPYALTPPYAYDWLLGGPQCHSGSWDVRGPNEELGRLAEANAPKPSHVADFAESCRKYAPA